MGERRDQRGLGLRPGLLGLGLGLRPGLLGLGLGLRPGLLGLGLGLRPGLLGLGLGLRPGLLGLGLGLRPGLLGLGLGTEFAGCDGRPSLLPLAANANGVAITRAARTPAALAATVFRRRLRARRSALLKGSCIVGASLAISERVERSRCSNDSVIAAAPAVPCSVEVGAAG
ncbi:hypothetical protein GCM10011608_40120 [Micromonospora sonchi]|uniref:Uncharacterized protein n=1 Tax=Micromonospora sonchi TaxID=1763543 RepID=A0A917U1C1_9ACTN|nr:hypothetical protein GCM10011608_40120 [Micromonospora sonchi]